jgi:oligoribonuclease (3'-5' exoribonuclease)
MKKYMQKPGLLIRPIDENRVIVMKPNESTVWEMNDVASLIWGEIKNSKTISSLVKKVVAEYDIDQKTAEQDVADFLEENVSRGLIVSS